MSKSSTQKTENSPPAWATPLLKEGAQAGLDLYHSGEGYTPYTGDTRAGFSDPTLSGMNGALAATGYTGPTVTNASWQQNPSVLNAKAMIAKLMADRAAKQAAQPAPAPVAEPKKKPYENRGGEGGGARGASSGGNGNGWGGH